MHLAQVHTAWKWQGPAWAGKSYSEAHAPTHYAIQLLNLKTFLHIIYILQKVDHIKKTGFKNKDHAEMKKK